MRIFLIVLIAVAALSAGVCAQEKDRTGIDDRIIGSTVKALAKTYLRSTSFKKLKKKYIEEIRGLDENGFRASYAHALDVIRESPKLKRNFGLDERMTRAQALELLEKTDRRTLCRMIDAVPDGVISKRFKAFMTKEGELGGRDLPKKVEVGWKTFRQRLEN